MSTEIRIITRIVNRAEEMRSVCTFNVWVVYCIFPRYLCDRDREGGEEACRMMHDRYVKSHRPQQQLDCLFYHGSDEIFYQMDAYRFSWLRVVEWSPNWSGFYRCSGDVFPLSKPIILDGSLVQRMSLKRNGNYFGLKLLVELVACLSPEL